MLAKQKFAARENKVSDAITDSWALRFKKMTPDQQLLTEKFVDTILFEGQMGTLRRDSIITSSGVTSSQIRTFNLTPVQSSSTASGFPFSDRTNTSTPVQNICHSSNPSLTDSDISQSRISNFFSSFTEET